MTKHKIIVICVAILSFLLFSVYNYQKSKSYDILAIKSPFEIVVDLNNNGIEDDDEVITILDGYNYIKHSDLQDPKNFSKYSSYNLSKKEIIALSYLTEKFVSDYLKDKTVTLKDNNIYLGTTNFNEKFLNSGFVFKDNKPTNEKALKKELKYINKTNFVIYNAKSNKYHTIDCKYGLLAHNYVFISKSQLPKGVKPCKYCHTDKNNYHKHNKHNKHKKYNFHGPNLNVKPVPIMISNGSIKVLITDYTTKLKPDRCCNTEVCKELVKQINNSQKSIDIAIYGYRKVPPVEKALKNAIARGVKIRLVYDINSCNTNIYPDTMYLVSIIKNAVNDKATFSTGQPSAYTNSIMHDKFYIFDDKTVMTGSANLSFTDMSGFNCNNVVVINSAQVAQVYKQEFEQMYNARFHYLKSKIHEKENIQIGNTNVSVYFSPKDLTIERIIIPLVNSARKQICIPAFLITDYKLAQALINAKQRGVNIKIILDAANAKSPYSKHKLLRQHGILVKTETFAGKLHSKTMIIDNTYSVIGSMNFSKSGEHKNDENMLVIKNSKIAVFNKIFFEYLWKKIDNYWLTHDASAEGLDSLGSCSDGIDNDYDGKIDIEDEGCQIHHRKK